MTSRKTQRLLGPSHEGPRRNQESSQDLQDGSRKAARASNKPAGAPITLNPTRAHIESAARGAAHPVGRTRCARVEWTNKSTGVGAGCRLPTTSQQRPKSAAALR
eukprot:3529979-Pyramimonas_sp.AAC.1